MTRNMERMACVIETAKQLTDCKKFAKLLKKIICNFILEGGQV